MLAAGIDVGTLFTKLVLLDGTKIIDYEVEATTTKTAEQAVAMMSKVMERRGIKAEENVYIIATGAGRKSVDIAVTHKTDYITFAIGAKTLNEKARIVVDIGGQGIRIVEMDEMGVLQNFRTNDKCSTGTGCFIDAMAMALAVDYDDLGELGTHAKNQLRIHSTCTVFAESEVVSLVAKGKPKDEIIAGLYGMVSRKVGAMIRSLGLKRDVVAVGGVARNNGIIKTLEKNIHCKVFVPTKPHIVGALGAALIAKQTAEGGAGQ
jgi:predicted CoA-substrate-specific enzyme activase